MKRRHVWMARYLPPGVDPSKSEMGLLTGLISALLFHLQFILRYLSARNDCIPTTTAISRSSMVP